MSKPIPAKPVGPSGNKNWLLVQFRKWHSWGGMLLSVLILLVAVTGILLNHKKLVFPGEKKDIAGLLRSTTDLSTVAVSFPEALALANDHYGDVPLEKIELKDEGGHLIYKVSRGEGQEIRIDAMTGALASKYGVSLDKTQPSTLHWAKIVDDLHTGKIFGTAGQLIIDFTSVVIIALTLTGIYLWGVPILKKRRSAAKKREAALASPARSAASSPSSEPALARSDNKADEELQAILAMARRRPAQASADAT